MALSSRICAIPGDLSAVIYGGWKEMGARGRVNWRNVLSALPKQFKAADVRNVRGLKQKRPSEIFAAITRWIDAGAARRRARGVYERV